MHEQYSNQQVLKDISRFGIQPFYPTVDDRDEDFVQEDVLRLQVTRR